jgi:CRISPR system Cascade subunit CasC
VERLRVSSQSLKRAWRVSDTFEEAMDGFIGKRSRRIGVDYVFRPMIAGGIAAKVAKGRQKKLPLNSGS